MNTVAVEHGSSRAGRWLRARRFQVAIWIAVVEGLLVIVGVIPGWASLIVGAGVITYYFLAGRGLTRYTARQASWVAAASQVMVISIPVLKAFVGFFAIIVLALLAALAIVVLMADRS